MSDKIRLLICKTCGSVEELPFYEGNPKGDTWLTSKTAPHKTLGGDAHIGMLATVSSSDWTNPSVRGEISKKIATDFSLPGHAEGLGQTLYDLKDNHLEDAMNCWKRHKRTSDCSDYYSEKMRVKADTRAERKAEGLDVKNRPAIFICQFCPVHSIVQQKQRAKAGLYD